MVPKEGVVTGPAWGSSIRTPRAFEAILGQFEEALASGELRAGDRLPAERDLAERFQTSRTSVREAVRALENFGVVEVRRGAEGVRICSTPREAFAELMRFHLALGHYRPEEVVEVRGALEANAVATVARAGDAAVLGELAAIATEMEDDRVDADAFHELDVRFHDRIVSAAGNELAALLHRSCRVLIRQAMREALSAEWPAVRAALAADHRAICGAVERRDGDQAARLMSDHVKRWGNRPIAAGRPCA